MLGACGGGCCARPPDATNIIAASDAIMARHFVRGISTLLSEMVVASRCYVELALRRSSPSSLLTGTAKFYAEWPFPDPTGKVSFGAILRIRRSPAYRSVSAATGH